MRRELFALFLSTTLPAATVDYVRDVAPLFEKRCVMCHSANATMGSLNLESYAGLKQGGNNGPVVAPGSPTDSLLYRSIVGQAPEIGRMPIGLELMPESETLLIRTWIEEGAVGPATGQSPAPGSSQIYTLAWRPDSKAVALGAYREVKLVDPTTQAEIAKLGGHADAVRALAYSKDAQLLAAAGGVPGRKGEVKLWKADGSVQATIVGHSDCIYAVAISPDGATIATASYDKLIKLWDAASGKEIKTLKDHTDAVYALAFTPDGRRLLSGAADRTVKVWDPVSGERLFTLTEATDAILTLAVSPDGKQVAAAGQDKSIRIWALEEKAGTLQNTLIAHEDAILKIAFSRDGKYLLSSSADRSVKLLRSADLAEIRVLPKQGDWAYALEVSPDGKSLAVGRINGALTITTLNPTVPKEVSR